MAIKPIDPKTVTPGFWWARYDGILTVVYVEVEIDQRSPVSMLRSDCGFPLVAGDWDGPPVEFLSKIEVPAEYKELPVEIDLEAVTDAIEGEYRFECDECGHQEVMKQYSMEYSALKCHRCSKCDGIDTGNYTPLDAIAIEAVFEFDDEIPVKELTDFYIPHSHMPISILNDLSGHKEPDVKTRCVGRVGEAVASSRERVRTCLKSSATVMLSE